MGALDLISGGGLTLDARKLRALLFCSVTYVDLSPGGTLQAETTDE